MIKYFTMLACWCNLTNSLRERIEENKTCENKIESKGLFDNCFLEQFFVF